MAKAKEQDKTARFIAELTVLSPIGAECVRGFDKAWRLALQSPMPVMIRLNRFVRVDD